MSVKKYYVPYNVNKPCQTHSSLLRERSFLHTRKSKSVIKSICSKDSFDRDQLLKKLPLKSLEGFLYDWLRCISNDKEDIDVIRDPIKLEKALSKLRSKAGFSEHSGRNKRV